MKELKLNYSENKKGFTIIEVVLVLAIAGLIFLMVFLLGFAGTSAISKRFAKKKSAKCYCCSA